jgi:hypothetical protein
MFNKKKTKTMQTYPSLLAPAGRYRYLRVSREVNPSIRVILYDWDLSRQPRKKVIIKGLIGPSSPLSWQATLPICISWEERPDALVPPLKG